jgi:hypothetical protein
MLQKELKELWSQNKIQKAQIQSPAHIAGLFY